MYAGALLLHSVWPLLPYDGIQALRHYRYDVDDNKSDPAGGHIALSKTPRHDWASHVTDAFRTAAVMIKEPEKKKEQEAQARE